MSFISVYAVKAVDTSDIYDVVDYLKANLRWIVKETDGTVVPTEPVSSLLITVQDEIFTHLAIETELPVYGTKTFHTGTTSGKAGSASS
ncbi:uncharacterized protein EAE98_006429 [Botrytis deweyae]|uniref:Tyrosinase C-terminal domain-containing protein n=2 Tax=Botrytis TaxID=33196 RepID=A0A4Z1JJZ7_9HELO|nr:uncharacterized protein EAE98_006429 [Botrytis deweyae]KAF7927045.1 hypothetical protein EAE98_006429 [Botrytis deweyae]TGO74041.1 hypothetical protein BELL_0313g00080 [Botrytis elliptica]